LHKLHSVIYAVDASKAFDRIDHNVLICKLTSRGLPPCFISTISCWYGKLYSSVRWHASFSSEFKVVSGVRQGGILSPILFNLYVDELIDDLKCNNDGCHVGNCFVGCIMYADDLLLLSPSLVGMQRMLDVCWAYGVAHNIIFNHNKTVSAVAGHVRNHMPSYSWACGFSMLCIHVVVGYTTWICKEEIMSD
jgi:retron-type reverse transcriptase